MEARLQIEPLARPMGSAIGIEVRPEPRAHFLIQAAILADHGLSAAIQGHNLDILLTAAQW